MRLYKFGSILTILAWLICLNPYWIIFAGLFFIIGIITIWFSNVKLKTKLLSTIIPVILWYPCFLFLINLGSNHTTPETFLVPKDFRGQITLIYDEPCGKVIPEINGRLIYKIPQNGVMIIKNEFETGIIDHEYYFVDENWNKIEEIPELIQQDFNEDYTLKKNENEPPRDKVGIFLLGTGEGSSFQNNNYKFHTMEVNSWNSLRVMNNIRFTDDLVDSLLYECRNKK